MWQIDQVTLRLFIAVCEEGTIARAAEREFIAPSAVSKRLADLGICRDVVPMGNLDVLPYRADHLALIVPRAHPLAEASAIGFEQTQAFDHHGLASNASVNALMQRIAVEKGHELNYRTYVSTFDAAYRFIQGGLAVAILPREALSRHAADEYDIVAVPLREAWAERRFVICLRDRQALTLAASHLLEHLLQTV